MRASYFLHLFTTIATAALWLLAFLLVWTLHRQWWHIRGVRRLLWVAPTFILLIIGLWALASWMDWTVLLWPLRFLAATSVIVSLAVVITLPLTGVTLTLERFAHWMSRKMRKRKGEDASCTAIDAGRRSLLVTAAAGVPLTFGGAGLFGAVNSTSRVVFPQVEMTWASLPGELEGLRLLHLSDLHLGHAHDLKDLETIVADASEQHADLVLITGDIADDVTMLPDALQAIASLRPRLGAFVSLGNHEYYAGLAQVLRTLERGPIPLLRDEGTTVRVGGATIHLLGIDDPARISRSVNPSNAPLFLRQAIDKAIDGGPAEGFRILMSHRPRGFDPAAELGIDLTLSGHTHGGIQLGFAGRSILEPFLPEQYFWGHYRKGDSQLYTSAGVGHWFPFRLGCPMEAPVYTLRRS